MKGWMLWVIHAGVNAGFIECIIWNERLVFSAELWKKYRSQNPKVNEKRTICRD